VVMEFAGAPVPTDGELEATIASLAREPGGSLIVIQRTPTIRSIARGNPSTANRQSPSGRIVSGPVIPPRSRQKTGDCGQRPRDTISRYSGAAMTRISISNAALEGIFHERMKAFVECPPEMKIAITSVESQRWGWMAITKPSDRIAHPDCAKRVAEIETELRVMFDLVDD